MYRKFEEGLARLPYAWIAVRAGFAYVYASQVIEPIFDKDLESRARRVETAALPGAASASPDCRR